MIYSKRIFIFFINDILQLSTSLTYKISKSAKILKMSSKEIQINLFLDEMKEIQEELLNYLETPIQEVDFEEYQGLKYKLDNIIIQNNQHKLKSLLYLISKISDNHHRETSFFSKIEQILQLFKDDILRYFSNSSIFNIFKNNKRILLILIEKNIMYMDEYIVKKIIDDKFIKSNYPQYFAPEIKPFVNEKWFPKYEPYNQKLKCNSWVQIIKEEKLPDSFYENRKKGENDDYICQLIREDSIDDFIIYVTKNPNSLGLIIKSSIYETNNFLIRNKESSLIEYAVFYGSIQILNYLIINNGELTSSLWKYAIHGKNNDIIHLLEENHINPPKDYDELYRESIKCHHIDIANYFQNNFLNLNENINNNILIDNLKYYNFAFIQYNNIKESLFCHLCKYDYYLITICFIENIKETEI